MITNLELYADPTLDTYVKAALEKKTVNLVILDIHDLSSIADVLLICSGRSNRQVKAIAEHIRTDLKKQGIKPISIEGQKEGQWVLMDYAHVIIHIFYDPVRTFYDLEGLWADAKRVRTQSLVSNNAVPDNLIEN
ncbi:ribosome silencing factor [Desulfococcaceae bacterium HSG9]|nr:ribosome silencing factor [Desulfococcaceae bacterium HSG9]